MHIPLCLQPALIEDSNPTEVEKQMAIKVCLNQITPENFHHIEILADIIAVGYETEEAEAGLADQVQPDTPSRLLPLSISRMPTLQSPRSCVLDATFSLELSVAPYSKSLCMHYFNMLLTYSAPCPVNALER